MRHNLFQLIHFYVTSAAFLLKENSCHFHHQQVDVSVLPFSALNDQSKQFKIKTSRNQTASSPIVLLHAMAILTLCNILQIFNECHSRRYKTLPWIFSRSFYKLQRGIYFISLSVLLKSLQFRISCFKIADITCEQKKRSEICLEINQ